MINPVMMTTLSSYKLVAALLIACTSLIAAIYPLMRKRHWNHTDAIHVGEAFACGVFLGAAFFHLLPDAILVFNRRFPHFAYPVPEAIAVLGFLLLLSLERLSAAYAVKYTRQLTPYLLTVILSIHALIEGLALGVGNTFSETILLFFAIVAHKGSESFALCITLIRHQVKFWRIAQLIGLFSVMTPLGILGGTSLHSASLADSGLTIVFFNAFAAGTFFYMATQHLRHNHHEEMPSQSYLIYFALGILIMAIIAIWA